jgi:sulfite oxidase
VKWVDRIAVADKESPCFYQRRDFKILPLDAVNSETANKYWDSTQAMLDMPINSTVSSPVSDTTVSLDAAGYIEVRDYAVPHGDQGPVVRVQVSGDEGASWTDAEIEDGGRQGSKWS